MDIKEIKKKKSDLETVILTQLKDFEKATAVKIRYLDVSVDRGNRHDIPCCGGPEKSKKREGKGLYDVKIDIDIK